MAYGFEVWFYFIRNSLPIPFNCQIPPIWGKSVSWLSLLLSNQLHAVHTPIECIITIFIFARIKWFARRHTCPRSNRFSDAYIFDVVSGGFGFTFLLQRYASLMCLCVARAWDRKPNVAQHVMAALESKCMFKRFSTHKHTLFDFIWLAFVSLPHTNTHTNANLTVTCR